jgi:hypothetical protein
MLSIIGYLIFNANFCSKCVVCRPLFRESQPIFGPSVLSFQAPIDLACVSVWQTGGFEFLNVIPHSVKHYRQIVSWNKESLKNWWIIGIKVTFWQYCPNKLTTPLSDFVFTSSLTSPKPAKTSTIEKKERLTIQITARAEEKHLHAFSMFVTIAFVEDIFGRFSKVAICWRDWHYCWNQQPKRFQGFGLNHNHY